MYSKGCAVLSIQLFTNSSAAPNHQSLGVRSERKLVLP